MKKLFFYIFVLVSPFVLTGCVGDIQGFLCGFFPDSDHCYQGAAIQEAEDDGCSKIKGEKFKDLGSNPPRDKCYLEIAENTGDLDACKKIQGGPMSYSQGECILGVAISTENPAGCKMLTGSDAQKCRAELGIKISPEKVLEVDDQIDLLKNELKNKPDADLEKQLKGLEEKKNDLLGVMTKNNKDEYTKLSDPTNRMIVGDFATGELDSGMKTKLIALNENLKKQGLKLDKDQYESIKDYYKLVSDPANDIEQMDDSKIVKDRWNEKVGNVVDKLKFWNSNATKEEAKLDEQLRFYERMLERQTAINGKLSEAQQDFDRNVGLVAGGGSDLAKDKLQDYVITSLLGEAANTTVGVTTKVLGEALDTVKGEAKSAEFRGLVKAYDQGMADEIGRFKGDVEKAHAEVVKQLQEDPYHYAESDSYAKYGNLLENKDCDGSNPHCVTRDVFWKSMKKSYKYQNK